MGGGNRKGPRGVIRSWDTRSTIAAYVGAVVRKGYRRRPQCTFVWLSELVVNGSAPPLYISTHVL